MVSSTIRILYKSGNSIDVELSAPRWEDLPEIKWENSSDGTSRLTSWKPNATTFKPDINFIGLHNIEAIYTLSSRDDA